MNRSPAFQFYPADYLSDENVVMMSLAGQGAYVRLMCYCWREGSIPKDIDRLARLCGIDSSAMGQLWAELKLCFAEHPADPERLVHPRLEKEREKQAEFHRERTESGKRGAKLRWEREKRRRGETGKADSSAMAQPEAELLANDASSSSTSVSKRSPNGGASAAAGNGKQAPRKIDTVWELGVNMLTTHSGMSDRDARSFLARLAKDYTKAVLSQAISTTSAAGAVDPKSYLVETLKNMKAGKGASSSSGGPVIQNAQQLEDMKLNQGRRTP
jgi:uncharacterized protein YdaU (DUF1376 family)